MITNISASIYGQVVFALAADEDTPNDFTAKIKDEIDNDPLDIGYEGLRGRAVHTYLHSPYSRSIPESWTPKSVVTGAELKNWIAPLKLAVRTSTAKAEVKATWLGIMGDFQGVTDNYTFDPATSTSWQSLVSQLPSLVDAGGTRIITDAHLQALTHTYREAYVEMAVPRVEALLGAGIALTLAEVEELI